MHRSFWTNPQVKRICDNNTSFFLKAITIQVNIENSVKKMLDIENKKMRWQFGFEVLVVMFGRVPIWGKNEDRRWNGI